MIYDGLIVNGDSYSAKYSETLTYANFLGNSLNIPVENIARVGSNNDRIVRSTIDFLNSCKFSNPLVIIGWSFIRRKEVWYYGSNRKILNNCFDRNSEPQLKFTTLDFLIEENEISDFEKSQLLDPNQVHKQLHDFYQNLFLLSNYLEHKKINYFWYSAADNTDCFIESFPALDKLHSVQWVKQHQKIYQLHNFCTKSWALINDNKHRTSTGHLSESGHKKFADFIVKHL